MAYFIFSHPVESQERDPDYTSWRPRLRPRPEASRPRLQCSRPRPRLPKLGLETSQDREPSLQNSKPADGRQKDNKRMCLHFLGGGTGGGDREAGWTGTVSLKFVSVAATAHVVGLHPAARLLIASQQVYFTDRQMPGWYFASIKAPAAIAAGKTTNVYLIVKNATLTL